MKEPIARKQDKQEEYTHEKHGRELLCQCL